MSTLAVIVVTHDSADAIGATLAAVERELGTADEVLVIDNDSRDDTVAIARAASPRAQVIARPDNPGFAAACHTGAGASEAPLLLFLNPDAQPQPGSLERLKATGDERPGWDAWQALVTMEDGRKINTAGGVVHFTGLGWAGRVGEPASSAPGEPTEVTFASGAAFVVRRSAWDELGGFEPGYFMYAEDLDLSLRLRLAGRGVGIEPRARVEHDYSFAKGDYKWFLLERNRWRTLLATYPTPLLALVAPALIAAELALLAVAAKDGWLGAKLRANAAVLGELPTVRRRRAAVQASRRITAAEFAAVLTPDLDSPFLGSVGESHLLRAALRAYWRAARALLGTGE